ncbi:IS200/IS605 family transposase [Mongoliitalea daihaiensis]|uniref:IS200/IS605 family transposase n=1 Tax=Mongoliitalea daihaiensis TaxID=2782006 RepID=UPI001F2BCCE6|nr:IS200/IS605 family transposase [Mongoliitalea daihaiensis]UJP64229.1 IS200/IS605 family transposase [Mongoliitalea daihaiensis]
MANTYSILLVQTVFAVKFRNALIQKSWQSEFHSVIGNLINETDCQSILVNGVADHVHCLFGFKPKHSLSDVLQNVKAKSSKWVNDSRLIDSKFEWQKGFGAFTYSYGQIDQVYQYIKNQEVHYKRVTFLEEYEHMLKKYRIEYDARYIFKVPE